MHKTPTCLVIGANGFVGSHVVDKLATKGLQIRAFDRFSKDPQFILRPNIEIVKGDFFNDKDLRTAIIGVDYVLHSFSATTPFISDSNPYVDVTDNLLRSVKVFDICASEGVQKIGFVSSGGAVYGSLAEQKIATEEDPPMPVSPYGINKLSIEYYLEYFKRKYGIQYIVYRLTNPYGPRQITKHNQGVIPTFLDRINKREGITIFGDGMASRDYIYIEDAASMIANSFEHDNKYGIYNIGSGTQTSLNEIIIELKKQLAHRNVEVIYADAPKTFLNRTGVSIERYITEFGEQSFTSLHDGLVTTLADAK